MTKALIIGGGIAGPVAAMALQRAGIDAVIYEAHPKIEEEVGSYLTLATNGIDALRTVEAQVLQAGFPTPTNVLLSGRGTRLGVVSNGGMLADGTVAHTFKRARLYQALHRLAGERGISIEFGKRMVAAEADSTGAVARFEDGTMATGDFIIGCDGINSVTRRIIDSNAPNGRYVGLVNFGGYTRGLELAVESGNWHMIFGKRAFFGYVIDPTGGVVWFANVPRAQVGEAERAATTTGQWKQQLIDLFADDRGQAADLIAAGELELAGDNTHDLPSVPTWRKGRIVIIGDAAHAPSPTSGQGASMACEDAVILAKCLRDMPDFQQAFSGYERLRRNRVERIVAQGARTSSAKMPNRIGRIVRDMMLPFVFRFLVTEKSLGWMYNHHIDWNDTVPEYSSKSASGQ